MSVAWLIGIARHRVADHFRPLERSERHFFRLISRHAEPTAVTWLGPRDEQADLVAALQRLPAAQRAAIVLRYVDDLPVREVAALLGRSEGAVESLLSRGRGSLRRLYGGDDANDRLILALRELDRPVEPDPVFADRLFDSLRSASRPARPSPRLRLVWLAAALLALAAAALVGAGALRGLLEPPAPPIPGLGGFDGTTLIRPFCSSSPAHAPEARPTDYQCNEPVGLVNGVELRSPASSCSSRHGRPTTQSWCGGWARRCGRVSGR